MDHGQQLPCEPFGVKCSKEPRWPSWPRVMELPSFKRAKAARIWEMLAHQIGLVFEKRAGRKLEP